MLFSAFIKCAKTIIVFWGLINGPTFVSATLKYISGPVCFGTHGSSAVLSPYCQQGAVTITTVLLGAKQLSAACPDEFEDGVHEVRCCVMAEEDCIVDQDKALLRMFRNECNGKTRCTIQTERMNLMEDQCIGINTFPNTTNYLYVEYSCVNGTSDDQRCLIEKIADNGELFIVESDFGTEMTNMMGTECSTCSVESEDCDSTIGVVTVRRRITMQDGRPSDCQEESIISVFGPQNYQNLIWSCHDVMTASSSSHYVKMHIDDVVAGSENNSDFWVGFKASTPARIYLSCPARDRQFCTENSTQDHSDMEHEKQEWHQKIMIAGSVAGLVVISAFVLVIVIVCLICRRNKSPGRPAGNGSAPSSRPVILEPPTDSPPPDYDSVFSTSCSGVPLNRRGTVSHIDADESCLGPPPDYDNVYSTSFSRVPLNRRDIDSHIDTEAYCLGRIPSSSYTQ